MESSLHTCALNKTAHMGIYYTCGILAECSVKCWQYFLDAPYGKYSIL